MPRAYSDVPPSPGNTSDSSDGSGSDTDDVRGATPLRGGEPKQDKTKGVSPVTWLIIGMVVMALAGAGVYFAVNGFPGSTRDGPSSTAASDSTPTKAETTAGGSVPSAFSGSGGASGSGGGGERGDSDKDEQGEETARPSRTAGDSGNDGDNSPTRTGGSDPTSSGTRTPSSSSSSGSLPPLVGTDLLIDFTTFDGSDLESFLSSHGIAISTYGSVFIGPIGHTFIRETVDWADGALRLKVVGQSSGTEEVKSAEIATVETITYGTVTTKAKATAVKGVCHGFFFYNDLGHEIDIELLSSFYTEGKGDSVQPGVHFTNHPFSEGGEPVHDTAEYGFDPTADFHDYTIEWKEGETVFSLDGKVVKSFTENVPSDGLNMIWNS
ncbi:hypothetical protein JCM11251_007053, partial [Rhodosporidiobolus azoricus]